LITDTTIAAFQDAVKTEVLEVDGKPFVTRQVFEAPQLRAPHKPATLTLYSLTGLVDYVKDVLDDKEHNEAEVFIHVEDPESVSVVSKLYSEFKQRDTLIKAVYETPAFPYGRFLPKEEFIIQLSSKFVENGQRSGLLSLAGNLRSQKILSAEDDGVSQQVIVRKGIQLDRQVTPDPFVTLAPFRTFTEVLQPASQFLFRMQSDYDEEPPKCALFESDGGAWKNEARQRVKDWLIKALEGTEIVVLA